MTLDEKDAIDTVNRMALEVQCLLENLSIAIGPRTSEGRSIQGIARLMDGLTDILAAQSLGEAREPA